MTDLYDALGVPRDADKAALRRAYRQRAKKVHPDHGGTPEQFALVKQAHDTLTDESARAHYDKTGGFGAKPVDNRHAELLNLLSAALDRAIATLYDKGIPPKEADMVAEMRRWLNGERQKPAEAKREFEKNRGRTAELVGRFTDANENNVMEMILRNRLVLLDQEIAKGAAVIAAIDRALAALDKVKFSADSRSVSDQELRRRAAEQAFAIGGGIADVLMNMGMGRR